LNTLKPDQSTALKTPPREIAASIVSEVIADGSWRDWSVGHSAVIVDCFMDYFVHKADNFIEPAALCLLTAAIRTWGLGPFHPNPDPDVNVWSLPTMLATVAHHAFYLSSNLNIHHQVNLHSTQAQGSHRSGYSVQYVYVHLALTYLGYDCHELARAFFQTEYEARFEGLPNVPPWPSSLVEQQHYSALVADYAVVRSLPMPVHSEEEPGDIALGGCLVVCTVPVGVAEVSKTIVMAAALGFDAALKSLLEANAPPAPTMALAAQISARRGWSKALDVIPACYSCAVSGDDLPGVIGSLRPGRQIYGRDSPVTNAVVSGSGVCLANALEWIWRGSFHRAGNGPLYMVESSRQTQGDDAAGPKDLMPKFTPFTPSTMAATLGDRAALEAFHLSAERHQAPCPLGVKELYLALVNGHRDAASFVAQVIPLPELREWLRGMPVQYTESGEIKPSAIWKPDGKDVYGRFTWSGVVNSCQHEFDMLDQLHCRGHLPMVQAVAVRRGEPRPGPP